MDDMDKVLDLIEWMNDLDDVMFDHPLETGMTLEEIDWYSLQIWARHELKIYVMSHMEKGEQEAIESFCKLMDTFACKARTKQAKRAFSVAYDVVVNILDMFLARR